MNELTILMNYHIFVTNTLGFAYAITSKLPGAKKTILILCPDSN